MNIFYWTGFVIGVALVCSPLLLLVPYVRRRVVYVPVARAVTGRWHRRKADPARIAALERELSQSETE